MRCKLKKAQAGRLVMRESGPQNGPFTSLAYFELA